MTRCGVALTVIAAFAAQARADTLPPAAGDARATAMPVSKKEAWLQQKRAAAELPARPRVKAGQKPARVINIFNTWTREWLAVDEARTVDTSAADRFLRCHYTNEPAAMDAALLPKVIAAARHFRVERVELVSGYRHRKYNLMLRKKGREVARDSQHTHGTAVDFRLPGVSVRALHRWAVRQKLGGVGLYLDSEFVHMDTGPIRFWTGD
jgi:uncharacterized protein YcbK (DUF882 family)